jgi:ribosomal protein L12E/L44/L45/RPP1/RPP2
MNNGDNQRQPTILPEVPLDDVISATSLGLSRLGWVAPVARVTFDQWAAILDAAMSVERASPWWVGDLMIYAQSQGKEFEDRALQALPYKDQTVRNYAVVCRVFDRTQRRGNLTIRHHAAVIKRARVDMSDAQTMLETAELRGWSVKELIAETAEPASAEAETASQAILPPETPAESQPDWRDALIEYAEDILSAWVGLLGNDTFDKHGRAWLAQYQERTGRGAKE